MEDALLKLGLAGIGLFAMGWFILFSFKENKKERKEEREIISRQFERMNEMSDETNKTMRENTNILAGLKSLLENQNRK